MLYDWSMESNYSTLHSGSEIAVACARAGGANATLLFFFEFFAAYFAKRNLNGGGFQSEGETEGGCGWKGISASPERSAGAKRRRASSLQSSFAQNLEYPTNKNLSDFWDMKAVAIQILLREIHRRKFRKRNRIHIWDYTSILRHGAIVTNLLI